MELRNSIARRFDLELPATLMFDHPSLAALAAYRQQLGELEDLLQRGDWAALQRQLEGCHQLRPQFVGPSAPAESGSS